MDLEQARAERKARREQKRQKRGGKQELITVLKKAYGHHQANQFTAAIPFYEKAVEMDANNSDLHNNYGLTLKELDRWDEAISQYRQAVAIDPTNAAAYNNLGNALGHFGRNHEAVKAYKSAVALKPDFDQFLSNLGVGYRVIAKFAEAEQVFNKILKLNPNFGSAYSNLATAQNALGNRQEALANFTKRFYLERGEKPLLPNHKSFLTTSKAKIDHDIEQFQHLHAIGNRDRPFDQMAELYESVRNETRWPTGDEPLVALSPDHLKRIGASYNRAFYVSQAPALESSAINADLDTDAITKAYFSGVDGIKEVATVDALLTEDALVALRKFLQQSTIWYDVYRRGYLGAYFGEGLECGLLLQIAEELSKKFPAIFRDHKLNQIWANKYDSKLSGIGLHADFAAVNINFWITPDEANLNPENGGLVVYGHEAPLDWDFESYNRDEQKIRGYLDDHNSQSTVIPYRCNRMGIFNSDLFHETDTIDFKPGYENRRINVTMLFGTRQTTHEDVVGS